MVECIRVEESGISRSGQGRLMLLSPPPSQNSNLFQTQTRVVCTGFGDKFVVEVHVNILMGVSDTTSGGIRDYSVYSILHKRCRRHYVERDHARAPRSALNLSCYSIPPHHTWRCVTQEFAWHGLYALVDSSLLFLYGSCLFFF